jgi:translocator protein
MEKFKKYVVIFIPILLGSLIGFVMNSSPYAQIKRPFLSPPGIVFPIVWSILYIIMGYSYYLVNKTPVINKIYYSQLFVNLMWPILFFKFKLYFLAALWIVLLIVLVMEMIIYFYNSNKKAGLLNLPYLFWLLFAFYLNLGVYLLN